MMRSVALLLLTVCLIVPGPVFADANVDRALEFVPADAVGIVCVPNVQSLDGDYQQMLQALQLNMMVPPPNNSIISMIETYLNISAGLEPNGPVALVALPAETLQEMQTRMALILPAADPAGMLQSMGAQATGDGLYSATLNNTPLVAATGTDKVVFALTPDLATSVAQSTSGIGGKFSEGDRRAAENSDLLIWFDAATMAPLLRPQIEGFMSMITMMQAGNPAAASQMEMNRQNLDMLMEGAQSVVLAARLGSDGLGLRFAMTAKPDSQLARKMSQPNVGQSLLTGLPAGAYMVAFGQAMDPEATRANIDQIDAMFASFEAVPEFEQGSLESIKSSVKDLAVLLTGFRATVEVLSPGSGGVIGAALLIDATDAERVMDQAATLVAGLKSITNEEEAKEFLEALEHKPDAEEIAGSSVDHIFLDLAKIEEVDDDDLGEIKAIIGEDGMMFRMAAVDSDTVAFSFGGGSTFMGRLIEQARSGGAPLESDPGIVKVAPSIPANRYSELYIAVDQIVEGIKNMMSAMGEEETLPISMPVLNAPVAMVASSGERSSQIDIFFPTDILVASKNAGMAMMMSGAMNGGQENMGMEENLEDLGYSDDDHDME